jgi:hypothetical protein
MNSVKVIRKWNHQQIWYPVWPGISRTVALNLFLESRKLLHTQGECSPEPFLIPFWNPFKKEESPQIRFL